MDLIIEQILIYGTVIAICAIIVYLYLRNEKKKSNKVKAKIAKAKEDGLYEPISLYPVIDTNTCIKSGACVVACPEKDILGIVNGAATIVNASQCIGHGACFHSCPVEAISLCIGTEKRGVDLPHVNQEFETNVPGIYIAGELGGMGLIKNSVEQGKSAVENMIKAGFSDNENTLDLVIIGAGPAGISAALMARKHNLKFEILEQDSLGGTVYTFPRTKIVMTSPMDLPLYGTKKLYNTSKQELLDLWHEVLGNHKIQIHERTKVESIEQKQDYFLIGTKNEITFKAKKVLIAIGRRGSPRKLNVPGEESQKVAYRLLEPEILYGKYVLVVGGGDSAVEAAMSLMDQNSVFISYRSDNFKRIKPKNRERLDEAIKEGKLEIFYNSNVKLIESDHVILDTVNGERLRVKNDLVYIFAGGELPTDFLKKTGIQITKRFGYTLKKHG